jgi:hypothetical protein
VAVAAGGFSVPVLAFMPTILVVSFLALILMPPQPTVGDGRGLGSYDPPTRDSRN